MIGQVSCGSGCSCLTQCGDYYEFHGLEKPAKVAVGTAATPSSPCACIGPVGDCPCIRLARGQKVGITETTISSELFALLPDEDKNTINNLKMKALGLFMAGRKA